MPPNNDLNDSLSEGYRDREAAIFQQRRAALEHAGMIVSSVAPQPAPSDSASAPQDAPPTDAPRDPSQLTSGDVAAVGQFGRSAFRFVTELPRAITGGIITGGSCI